MATKTVWYFGWEDRKEIETYSKEITKLFKIRGFTGRSNDFDRYFDLEEFDFIPCIKEGLQKTKDYDKFYKDAMIVIVGSYDPSVEVTLQDLEEYWSKPERKHVVEPENINNFPKGSFKSFLDFVKFISSCDDDTKQKFLNWAF